MIVHSGVPDGSNSPVWGQEKYIVSFTVARAGVTLRGGELTWLRPERLENTRNIYSSHSAQVHLFHLGIMLFFVLFCFRKGQRWQDIWFFLCESHASRRNNNPRRRPWAVCIQGGLFKAFLIMFLLWLLFISLPESLNLSYPCVKSGLISQNCTPPA